MLQEPNQTRHSISEKAEIRPILKEKPVIKAK